MKRTLFTLIIFLFFYFNIYGQEKQDRAVGSDSKSDYTLTEGHGGLHGYIGYGRTKPPEGFGAGISFYTAVWPLIDKPLANYQIGLPGVWIVPENSNVDFPLCPKGTTARDNWAERGPTWGSVFQTIEGGLGLWGSTQFRLGYKPPKFQIVGVPDCYSGNYLISPGWSNKTTASAPDKMGIAQLSNRFIIPPDGFTFEGYPDGQFFGYAWMNLPLTEAREGPPPTGDHSWTLFLNTANFKGPVAFFIPEAWSKISKDYSLDYGRGLDSRLGDMGGGAMEINSVPKITAKNNSTDSVFYKIPQLHFPADSLGRTYMVQDVRYYSKEALYNPFKEWRDGVQACSGAFQKEGIWEPVLNTWMPTLDQGGVELKDMDDIFQPVIFSDNVFGIQWKGTSSYPAGEFPQYFLQVGDGDRVPVADSVVPPELIAKNFKLADEGNPYISPETGVWGDPGPVSDPIKVTLADGSTVTYRWYRFIDQPSLQQFDWSKEKREKLQALVEKIHANWLISKDYMEPPRMGELATLDSALIVTPPSGYEVGYVPIVTGQE